MAQPFPLQSLLDLSQTRLDDATRRLGELIASQAEATQRLDLLVSYRAEYETRYLTASQNGLDLQTWQNYRAFLDRLDTAIQQAHSLVVTSEHRTAAGQKDWLETRGKVKAFDTLAERHRTRILYAENRREQKQFDEHAARRHQQRNEDES